MDQGPELGLGLTQGPGLGPTDQGPGLAQGPGLGQYGGDVAPEAYYEYEEYTHSHPHHHYQPDNSHHNDMNYDHDYSHHHHDNHNNNHNNNHIAYEGGCDWCGGIGCESCGGGYVDGYAGGVDDGDHRGYFPIEMLLTGSTVVGEMGKGGGVGGGGSGVEGVSGFLGGGQVGVGVGSTACLVQEEMHDSDSVKNHVEHSDTIISAVMDHPQAYDQATSSHLIHHAREQGVEGEGSYPHLTPQQLQEEAAKLSWAHGANNMVLFHSDDNKVSVGVNHGAGWCENLSLLSIAAAAAAKTPFEVLDPHTQCAYQLAYCTTQLPGAFRSTQLVTLMPRYCIVNCLDEPLELRQFGTLPIPLQPNSKPPPAGKNGTAAAPGTSASTKGKLFSPLSTASQPTIELTPSTLKCAVPGQTSMGWHRYDWQRGTNVQIRCGSSAWSLGGGRHD